MSDWQSYPSIADGEVHVRIKAVSKGAELIKDKDWSLPRFPVLPLASSVTVDK